MKSWLKGGLILGLITSIFLFVEGLIYTGWEPSNTFEIIYVIIFLPLIILFQNKLISDNILINMIFFTIFAFIFYFIIGALIGLIYEKIKNRNN